MNNSTPLVSIVIPVYNGTNYLREAIDSALAQTYPNCEILVVNDGSTDNGETEAIALSYGESIRYFRKENGGVSSALNLGIREMRGEYFSWLSHDDVYSPNRIAEDINIISKQKNVFVTFCRVVIIDSTGKFINEHNYHVQTVENLSDALRSDSFNMCALTINRHCFDLTGMFDEDNRMTQDVAMLLLLASKFKFHFNQKSVVFVREHQQRGTHRFKGQHRIYQRKLIELIDNNFTLDDFFPGYDKRDTDVQARNLSWMGDFYCFYGAYEAADNFYIQADRKLGRFLSSIKIRRLIGARLLDSSFVRSVVKFKKRIAAIYGTNWQGRKIPRCMKGTNSLITSPF